MKKIASTKTIRISFIGIAVILAVGLFSRCCYEMVTMFEPKYYEEEDLYIHYTIDRLYYEYQEKVLVTFGHSNSYDSLEVRVIKEDSSDKSYWFHNDAYSILSGQFEKVGWYDDKLFILMDGVYYSIDIDEYEIAPLIENEYGEVTSLEYELEKYSENELEELYPNWESFDWERGFVAK